MRLFACSSAVVVLGLSCVATIVESSSSSTVIQTNANSIYTTSETSRMPRYVERSRLLKKKKNRANKKNGKKKKKNIIIELPSTTSEGETVDGEESRSPGVGDDIAVDVLQEGDVPAFDEAAGGKDSDRTTVGITVQVEQPKRSNKSTKGVAITQKNGGAIYTFEFTTPGIQYLDGEDGEGDDNSDLQPPPVTVDAVEEDVVDISTPTTMAPSKSPTAKPVMSNEKFPCGMTPDDRRTVLTGIATRTGIIEDGSPQQKALDWLVDYDDYVACPGSEKTLQRYALAVFYYSTEGDNWIDCSADEDFAAVTCSGVEVSSRGEESVPKLNGNSAWLSPVDECLWAGIECIAKTKLVDRIEFEDNGLAGQFPSELEYLSNMRFLYAEKGAVSGTIPPELALLKDLLVIDFDYNQLTGTIPESIYSMGNLVQLDLNNNPITGTLSSKIGVMTNLKFLQIGYTDIGGVVPDQLGALNLAVGGFEFTGLSGTMPATVCNNLSGRLIADCLEGPEGQPPKIECDCCSVCVNEESTPPPPLRRL